MWRYPLAVLVCTGAYFVTKAQGAPRWGAAVVAVIVTIIVLEVTALWQDRS